jgi:soluble lytic murein transglycosylase-like protein|tara:strand:- start:2715 stop:3299 length:585 start_codon:yes stop_codon:yes gene_type:complete
MKTLTKIILVAITVFALLAFAEVTKAIVVEQVKLEPLPIVVPVIEIKAELLTIKSKSHQAFLEDIGERESSGRYEIVNAYGYLGKYQFGRKTLNSLGYKDISNSEFLNNHSIQEEAMLELLIHNKKVLRKQIRKYHGEWLHGVMVTESGLLAAAHLAGPGNVRKWIRRGNDFKDGLGTSMTSYMINFSGYSLEL